MRTAIMYIEDKCGGLAGPARIGRVTFSKTGRTLYYAGRSFLVAGGYKVSHFDAETREEFWISRPRKDGQDALYPTVVDIDEDVREEYWLTIRERPDLVHEKRFRSEGKYSKRRQKGTLRRPSSSTTREDLRTAE